MTENDESNEGSNILYTHHTCSLSQACHVLLISIFLSAGVLHVFCVQLLMYCTKCLLVLVKSGFQFNVI